MGLRPILQYQCLSRSWEYLGNPLFDRINKKLILNEMGRSFEKEIAPIVKRLRDIEYEFKEYCK